MIGLQGRVRGMRFNSWKYALLFWAVFLFFGGETGYAEVPREGDTDHPNVITSPNCSPCHMSNDLQEIYALHKNDCESCHASTSPAVLNAIKSGLLGSMVNCENCHTLHDGPKDHASLSNSPSCIECHGSCDFGSILMVHRDCLICHDALKKGAINTHITGKGGMVPCEGCHADKIDKHVAKKANNPPVLTPINNLGRQEGKFLKFAVTATDDYACSVLVFEAGNIPPGATFDRATGVFSWTPDCTQAGTYHVTFKVTDDGIPNMSSRQDVVITVVESCGDNQEKEDT